MADEEGGQRRKCLRTSRHRGNSVLECTQAGTSFIDKCYGHEYKGTIIKRSKRPQRKARAVRSGKA